MLCAIDSRTEFVTGIPVGTREMNTSMLSGFNFNGAMYQTNINKKLTLYSGLNYTIENTLKSKKHQEHIYGDTIQVSILQYLIS
jgi:hypothetical protein